jgi:glyoxylase-like metal-dependent hydrolase (beta-lactamase superfamily II)
MVMLTRRNFVISAATASAVFGLNRPIEFMAPALAQAPAAPPKFVRFKIGDIEVTQLYDGIWQKPHDPNFIKNVSVEETKKELKAAGLTDEHVPITFTVTVIKSQNKYAMFDAGTGSQVTPTAGLMMTESMKAAGIDPKNISTILVTHYHADHIFGLMAKDTNAQVFPNAEIVMPAAEYKYWTDPSVIEKLPEARRGLARRIQATFPTWKNVRQVENDKEAIKGVRVVSTPGHTPGHTSYLVSSGRRQLLVLGDVSNIPALFVKHPDWQAAFDQDANLAQETRRKTFDRVVAEKLMVTGYHYGMPGAGTIAKDGNGYVFKPIKA